VEVWEHVQVQGWHHFNFWWKVSSSLDECLLDEDIGGFIGSYLFDDIGLIKESDEVMNAIFGWNCSPS